MNSQMLKQIGPAILSILLLQCDRTSGQELAWIRQFGSSANDKFNNVSVDNLGNVFVAGDTFGGDSQDLLLRKYNTAGELAWTRQLDLSSADRNWAGVAADGLGNVYISGSVLVRLSYSMPA